MSIKKQAIAGVKWTTLSSATLALAQILKISILARLLDKGDFGLMALVVLVINFLNLFMDMGLSSAILHKSEITRKEYSSLYWINVSFSIILFLLLVIISPLISAFYEEEELVRLLPLMGSGILFAAIGRQFKTIAQKQLKFRMISLVEIFSAIFALIVAIILAIKGFGVYSLVIATLIQIFISNMFFFISGIKKNTIFFRHSFGEAKPFLKIGVFQVGGQIVNYFSRDVDILIIGKVFGSDVLGGYSLAKQLVFRPVQLINPILTKVASPVLVKFQGDIGKLRQNYLRLVNIVSSVNTPIYIFISIFASLIVYVLYGSDFESIVPLVRILSIYMILRSIGNPVGSLVIATGRTDLEFYWNLVVLAIMPVSIWFGAGFGIVGVASSILLFRILLFIPSWYFLIWGMLKVPLKTYVWSIIPRFRENYKLFRSKN